MLGGTGLALTLIMAATVVIALVGTTLACLNTGVRVTYAMGKDKEVPSVFGALHGRFATPYWGIWILVAVSAIIGAYGVLSVDNLTQVTLASNTGTFLIYGLTNLIALIAFFKRPGASFIKHRLIPVFGFLANLLMLCGIVFLGIKAGGSTSTDAYIALAMVAVWMVIGIVWFMINTQRQKHPVLVHKTVQLNPADLASGDGE